MELSRYAPELVLRRLAIDPRPPSEPYGEAFSAAVMWVDISGFTPLTERLVAAGPAGVEELTEVLNRYYGRLVELVQAHGGDITQFEGDAILAVWRLQDAAELPAALSQVGRCALEVSEHLHDFDVGGGVHLSQRVAVAGGRMRFLWVGGVLARWTFTTAGAPLADVQAIDHDVPPGQVVVAARSWPAFADHAKGTRLESGSYRLESISRANQMQPLARSDAPRAVWPALRTLLPGAVLSRLQAGQGRWLAELRTVSVLFVHFADLDQQDPDLLNQAQHVVQRVQHAVYRWGGSSIKFSMADKGTTLLVGFGVPPLAHEDDPLRAVRAALAIEAAMAEQGRKVAVGVTTGQVFCGLLGSDRRCEYTILGRAVNLAARLMVAAKSGILVDETTFRAARGRLEFTTLAPLSVRGFPQPIQVYSPTGAERAVVRDRTEIVGRTEELELISRGMQELVRAGRDGAVVLEGEAGIGKSRLVAEAIARARGLGVRVLYAEAQAIERDTAYFAWRDVAADILGIEPGESPSAIREHVEAVLRDAPELLRLAPLLAGVLSVEWPDNAHTAEMVGQVRADNLRHLLVGLVERLAADERVMLVIEDAHWLDSASWGVSALVARDVHPCLVLVASRPFGETPPSEYTGLLERADTTFVALGNLSPEETLQLVCQRLGVVRLPIAVGTMLIERSGGNPFFSEELAFALRDSGALLVDNGTCGLAPGEDLESLSLPSTVQGAIISRVDKLSPAQQLLLKVASVVGREFRRHTLVDVYPVEETGDDPGALLESLLHLELVIPEDESGDSYIFKHALGQETIYGLMLFAQRRELHARVAGWFEAEGAEDLERYFPVLAYHFSHAQNVPKGAHYLQAAGEQALGQSANREAIRFFDRALALCQKHPEASTVERLTVVQEGLAQAHHGAGDMDRCLVHGRQALELLGRPSAANPVRLFFALWGQVILRVAQARWPDRFRVDEREAKDRLRAAARIENRFSEIAVFREENLRCVYSTIRQLNMAAPGGPSPELGRAYAQMSSIIGAIPLAKIADAWVGRAMENAAQLDSQLDKAWIWIRCACYELYRARWETTYAWSEEAVEVTHRLGDQRLREEALVTAGLADMYRGRFARGAEVLGRLMTAGRASGNRQTFGWGAFGRAEALVRMGEAEEALGICAEFAPWLDGGAQSSERVWGHAVSALAHLYAGDRTLALEHADRVYDEFIGSRPMAFWNQQTAPAVAEVYWDALQQNPDDALLGKKLRRSVKNVRTFGKIFVFGEAQSLYWQGVLAWTRGKPEKAFAFWRSAVERGDALDLAFDAGLAHRELGRFLPAGHAERARHIDEAQRVLRTTCQALATVD